MKIYLIANNSTINNHWINKFNKNVKLNKDDLVVRFNKCLLSNIFNGYTTHYFSRDTLGNFTGFKDNKLMYDFLKNDKINFNFIFNKIYYNKNINKIHKLKESNNLNIDRLFQLSIVNNLSFSSGFIAIQYFLNKYKNAELILVGFNFYNQVVNWHNFKYEYSTILKLARETNRIKSYI